MSRRRSNWQVRVTSEQIVLIARQQWPLHDDWHGNGFELTRSSGLWRSRNGSFTLRLVYRRQSDRAARTVTVRGVRHGELLAATAAQGRP